MRNPASLMLLSDPGWEEWAGGKGVTFFLTNGNKIQEKLPPSPECDKASFASVSTSLFSSLILGTAQQILLVLTWRWGGRGCPAPFYLY